MAIILIYDWKNGNMCCSSLDFSMHWYFTMEYRKLLHRSSYMSDRHCSVHVAEKFGGEIVLWISNDFPT